MSWESNYNFDLEGKPRSDRRVCLLFGVLAVLCYALAGCLATSGCSTVRPAIVESAQPSWDGNQQNSGLLGMDEAGNRIVTGHARDRYNALMDDYGERFSPPVHRDEGVTATGTNTWLIDPQHLFYFATANRWRKQKEPAWHQ